MSLSIDELLRLRAVAFDHLARDARAFLLNAAVECCGAIESGRSLYFIGNGGSAAIAEHLAAELEGRFEQERRPLPALALTANTATLTAIANDYGYVSVFDRLVRAHVRVGDVVVVMSTSGVSPNIVLAAKATLELGARLIGLIGTCRTPLAELCHVLYCAPAGDAARIQECHLAVGHILCGLIEDHLHDRS